MTRRRGAGVLGLGLALLLAACGGNPLGTPVSAPPTATVAGLMVLDSPAPVLGLVVDPQLRIGAVDPGSGAAQAGLRPGDVLLAVEGRRLHTAAEAAQNAQETIAAQPVRKVAITVRRGTQERIGAVLPGPPGSWQGGSPDHPLLVDTPIPAEDVYF